MRKTVRIMLAVLAFVLPAALLFAACGKPDVPDPAATEAPTERPTEVPMRDLSNDTPLADTLVYANRMANEVQAFFSVPERTRFTVQNSSTRFELELAEAENYGITYFGDYYGTPYFSGSMDAYALDSSGMEWTDRASGSHGRQNTYRLGYYYTEVHLMDLSLGMAGGDELIFTDTTDIFEKTGWNSNMATVVSDDDGVKITVDDPTDPYAYRKLSRSVPQDKVDSVRITVISQKDVSADVYYFDSAHSGFNGEQHTSISLIGDGKAHTYLARLDALAGDLKGIRLDPNGSADDVFIITGIEAVKAGGSVNALLDRIYYVYSDKLHQSFRFVARSEINDITQYGMVWKVSADTVDALQIRDAAGTHNDLSFEPASVEYVAFHIRDNGVVGIIIPSENSGTNNVTVELKDGVYVVRQFTDTPPKLRAKADYMIANRLYNDKNSTFDAIDAEAYLERNPLTGITVNETNSKTKFKGYDHVTGCYTFTKNGTDFSNAYKKANRNKYYTSNVTVSGDGRDRSVYMRFASTSGCLECAALFDETGLLVPVPMEVCKNFCGEYEEPVFDPRDTQYGESIFPLVVKSGRNVTFTELHLYQNWGTAPLKQISSIQFFIGYYHLSCGTTESNCIAPYFVYGKDGWTLPDFRGPSGVMWSTQPQFTSIGIHKWLSYVDAAGKTQQSEYTGTRISSSGPSYADIDYSYISDCGSYRFDLRHVEFPQNDENRTYYTISVEFLKDITFEDAKNNFTLLHFNSRDTNFTNFMYLAADGTLQTETLPVSGKASKTYDLNKGSFYYAIYGGLGSDGKEKNGTDIMNYALILRDSRVTLGGKDWDGTFSVRYVFDGHLDNLSLTFNEGRMAFKKGDTIKLNVILLPFGGKPDDAMNHAPKVYEDSVLHPLTITAQLGTVIEDDYVPKIAAYNNIAEFTLTGSRKYNTVAVYGFDTLARPRIMIKENGEWKDYVTSVKDGDGYQVALSPDGTYVYSFVYETSGPEQELCFRIEVFK